MKAVITCRKGDFMLKLGIIGTGAISHYFIDAAHASQEFQLVAVLFKKAYDCPAIC